MEENQQIRLRFLLEKYLSGRLDNQEMAEMHSLISLPDSDGILEEYFMKSIESDRENNDDFFDPRWDKIWLYIENNRKKTGDHQVKDRYLRMGLFVKIACAASLLIAVFFIGHFYLHQPGMQQKIASVKLLHKDIQPGKNGAILHLSDGSEIDLSRVKDGVIAKQGGGTKIFKQNGMIKYEGHSTQTLNNYITTNRGRQWHVILPDGTKVWLNASSSITYPLCFSGKYRVVQITGEVYFEVVHNALQPFKVEVDGQVIEDIGTAFNVDAYKDNGTINTTLLSGKVSVTKGGRSVLLDPGQQAKVDNKIKVVNMDDVDNAIGWKNGLFTFSDASITSVMKQIARWYNVEVVYNGGPEFHQFTGSIPRNMTLSEILKVLQQAGVHFMITASNKADITGKIIVEQ